MIRFVLLLLLVSLELFAVEKYSPFITQQIGLITQLNEYNSSKEESLQKILKEQEISYQGELENIMSRKQEFLAQEDEYSSKIYNLERIMKINKRAGYTNAVLRDEIQVTTYKILQNQRNMLRNILLSLENSTKEEFHESINRYVVQNQLDNEKILKDEYISLTDMSSIIKENLQEYYAIIDLNADAINYLYKLEGQMYRLDKYSDYHLIGFVLFVNNIELVKELNTLLKVVGLNVIKILIMLTLVVLIYMLRTVVYVSLENYLLNIESLKEYVKDILRSIRRPVQLLIMFVNVDIVTYVYTDFSHLEYLAEFFNIVYALLIIYMVYKVINAIARAKIHEINTKDTKLKNEVINLAVKIVNFIIIVIGILWVLYLAGANLTAVLSGLGIGGFAVALAAKDSLANFFGTLSILMSDVYSQGDWIVVDGKEGVVVEIGLRVTTLRTFDNALIAIPNATLANKDVKNWNKRELGRRIKMSLGIKYDSQSEDIKNAVKEIREMLDKHPKIATENTQYQYANLSSAKLVSKDDLQGVKKTLLVYLDEFSDSSINILVYCFTKSTNWDEWLATKEDVMHKIMAIFENNNLEFAFPSLSLYNENT